MPNNEAQPSLIVLDSLHQLPSDESPLFNFLKRVSLHIVVISKMAITLDSLQTAVDRRLIRGTRIIDVQPLSTIHATQRLVHSVLKNHHLTPSTKEQAIFEKLAEFTTGSPPILNLTSSLLNQSLTQADDCTTSDGLHTFANRVQLAELPLSKTRSVPRDHMSAQPQEPFLCTATRDISREVYETIKTRDDEDVFITNAEYDSWQVTAVLIRQCNLTPQEQLLLYCLSSFNCCPIPTTYVTELATIITKAVHQPHLASSLANKLEKAQMLKVYPKPSVYHSTLMSGSAANVNMDFVYVPRFVAAAVWKDMMCDVDKVMALVTCYKAFKNALQQQQSRSIEHSFLMGLGSVLVESYELHFKLLGKSCFQEMYKLFLSADLCIGPHISQQ